MKSFLKKYGGVLLVLLLAVAFVLLIVLTEDKTTYKKEVNADLSSWIEETKEDKNVVTVFALTTCGHCSNYKPVIEGLKEEYNFELYWFYLDNLSNEEYATLTSTYELEKYEGSVPYTLITKNGAFIGDTIGAMEDEATYDFLVNYNVIE